MANGRSKGVSKTSASASKAEDEVSDPKQFEILNTRAFSDLSEKIQAQFSKLGNASGKDTSKLAGKHVKPPHQEKAPNSTAQTAFRKPQSRGKKRNSQGVVKEQDNPKASTKQGETISVSKNALEKEVYALGGNAEDLALVINLDSESELDEVGGDQRGFGKTKFEQGLKKGIADILKQIDECEGPASLESDAGEEEYGDNTEEEAGDEPSSVAKVSGNTSSSQSRSGRSNLIVGPRPDWFNVELPPTQSKDTSNFKPSPTYLHQLHEHAKSLLDTENEAFKASQRSSSSQNFYSTVIASGTLSDKISALTLAVQESPLHNAKALETLINLGKKRSRAQAIDVLRALKDLFAQGSLLPSDRKLYAFSSHPSLLAGVASSRSWNSGDALPSSLSAAHLIVWAYESWLKEKYFEVLKILEVWCNDEIEFAKAKAVNFVYELLKEKPEQESNLLRLLTNKLGDPSKKVASQTSYLLMQLMAAHPLMKMTIILSIDSDLLFRPGQSLHAKYYAAITLNQTALSVKEEEVASKLLSIYFSLFVDLLRPAEDKTGNSEDKSRSNVSRQSQKKSFEKHVNDSENAQADDLREKLISATLTGINRAYPYTQSDSQSLAKHLETLFKITHSSNFNTSIQAMILIQQICSSHQASVDRFYRTLYESLLDARLINSSKQSLYLNLLYRALKADTNLKRVKAFAKRILQMLALHQPSFACGCFFLLQELRQTFPALGGMIDQPEEHDLDDEMFEDVREQVDEHPLPEELPRIPDKSYAYDGRKRDPEHSNAENSCLWELVPFLTHFHPSVSVGAEHFLRQAKLPGKPDLELHTLVHFLDRFAYRNAKLGMSNLRGSSIMQPLAGSDSTSLLVSSTTYGQVPVNSEKFKFRDSKDVAAEDVFFHQYFNSLGRSSQDRKTRKKAKSSGDDDDSEDEESEIWKAMMESAPDLEGADESDQDLEMSDLESDFEQSLEAAAEDDDPDDDDETDGQESALSSDEVSTFSDLETSLAQVLPDTAPDHDTSAVVDPKVIKKGANSRRRKVKQLPIFASASDYAQMIDDEEEDVG